MLKWSARRPVGSLVNKPGRFLILPALFAAAALLVASALVASDAVVAATLRVPQDYPTIQAAINAAHNGDLVLVSPGVYNENLTLSGNSLPDTFMNDG